jgi:hypothetical protein
MDIVYLVVVVPKGETFSGWDNYVDEEGHTLYADRYRESERLFGEYFTDHTLTGGNKADVPWFGTVNLRNFPYIKHQYLGDLYCTGSGGESLWMYSWSHNFGWIWTTPELFPYFYSSGRNSWIYYILRPVGPQWFYIFESDEWLSAY